MAGHVCGSRVRGGEFRFSVVVAGSLEGVLVASLLLWCQITVITIIIIVIMQLMS